MSGEKVRKKKANKVCKITASTCAFSSVESRFVIKKTRKTKKKKKFIQ